MVEKSGLPYTILRAAQLHEFVVNLLTLLARGGLQFLPSGFVLQPVQTEAVAARLAKIALSSPQHRVTDLLGPEPRSFVSLGREWLAATKQTKRVVVVPMPQFVAKAWQPVGSAVAETAGESWTQWLQKHSSDSNPYRTRS